MIRPAEIQKKANKERVRDTQIEKDYILTWILSGVANNEVLSKVLKDQIAELPPFEQVQRELGKHFRALLRDIRNRILTVCRLLRPRIRNGLRPIISVRRLSRIQSAVQKPDGSAEKRSIYPDNT